MTSPVRPPILPPTLAVAGAVRPDPARLAAQRAFFQIASGEAIPPAAPPAPARGAEASVPVASKPADEPPQKILRPGSLIDIRV